MTDVNIGDKVLVSTYLSRYSEQKDSWTVELTWNECPFEKQKTMYIIGKKTLSNGELEVESEWDEYSGKIYESTQYRSKSSFNCYIVTERLRGKHYKVPCDKVKFIND